MVVVLWSSRTQPPSSCAWFIFLICLKKYDEKYAKPFLAGVRVCEWDGAVTRPEPGWLCFMISRSVPTYPLPTPHPPPPTGDAKSKASRRLEEAFRWFVRSGHGTRARASAALTRSAGKVGVSASEGWPGLSEPAGGTCPLVPGVGEAGLNPVRLPRRSRDPGFAALFVGVLLERFF